MFQLAKYWCRGGRGLVGYRLLLIVGLIIIITICYGRCFKWLGLSIELYIFCVEMSCLWYHLLLYCLSLLIIVVSVGVVVIVGGGIYLFLFYTLRWIAEYWKM